MTAEQAEDVGLPCIAGKCASDNARTRLAAGDFDERERADLESAARACEGKQQDPWTPTLEWEGCPAKAAYVDPDVSDALIVRGLSRINALHNWPHGYSARVADVMAAIAAEESALRNGGLE